MAEIIVSRAWKIRTRKDRKYLTEQPCSVNHCPAPTCSGRNGLCDKHYQRNHITGTTKATRHYIVSFDPETLMGFCEKCETHVRVTYSPDNKSHNHPVCTVAKKAASLKSLYGISIEEYDAMVETQDGKCAICRKPPRKRRGIAVLFVDHSHKTGAIREGLCEGCNIAIGMIDDDPEIAQRMVEYLIKHRQ